MPRREPAWWYGRPDAPTARALAPFGWLYGRIAARRLSRTGGGACGLPVICVGNFTAGGTGKTPFALLLASLLRERGEKPAFLSRGYGGSITGPHWVDPTRDGADRVGDEPRLLAVSAPTLVASDRLAGARTIAAQGDATVIVMDDGLQNPALAKALVIAIVDGRRGFGNGRCIPAGPLRAPLAAQLAVADVMVVNLPEEIAATESSVWAELRGAFTGPVVTARVAPSNGTDWLVGAAVVAFAGIGVPDRFFALLGSLGAQVVARVAYPDHHAYSEADARHLLACAGEHAMLVTTEKDMARMMGSGGGGRDLPASGARGELARAARALPVRMRLDDDGTRRLTALLDQALGRKARA